MCPVDGDAGLDVLLLTKPANMQYLTGDGRLCAYAMVSKDGMAAVVDAVTSDIGETEVAAAAESAMRHAGAEGFWRSYVSSGPRTNIAHGLPTRRALQPGDLVMIDIHPIVEGYEAPLPAGHAFFHGEKELPALEPNTVISIGNCRLYTGPWGVRVEDTIVIGTQGPTVLTNYPRAFVSR